RHRRELLLLEGIRRAARAARVLPVEASVLERRLQLRAVLIEAERQRAVLECPAGRGHLLVAVEEGSFRGGPRPRQLDAERDLDAVVDDDRGVPEAVQRLGGGRRR